MLQDRTAILKRIVEISSQQDITAGILFELLEKNRYHWKDELAKTFFQKLSSKIKRMQKKEDILYL
jgi:hypothetical protein